MLSPDARLYKMQGSILFFLLLWWELYTNVDIHASIIKSTISVLPDTTSQRKWEIDKQGHQGSKDMGADWH